MPNGMPFPNGQNPHNPNQVNPTRKPPMPQYTRKYRQLNLYRNSFETFLAEQINQLREDKVEILSHHQIKEISPIAQSRDGVRENPAATLNSTIHQLADRKYPWLRSDRSRKKHGVYGLHEEIVDFHKWIIATPEEYQMRFEGKHNPIHCVYVEWVFPLFVVSILPHAEPGRKLWSKGLVLKINFSGATSGRSDKTRISWC